MSSTELDQNDISDALTFLRAARSAIMAGVSVPTTIGNDKNAAATLRRLANSIDGAFDE